MLSVAQLIESTRTRFRIQGGEEARILTLKPHTLSWRAFLAASIPLECETSLPVQAQRQNLESRSRDR